LGFFTSKVEDLETVFNVLRVHGENYPISNSILSDDKRQKQSRPWKVALLDWKLSEPYARKALLDWAFKIGQDMEIAEPKLPSKMERCHEIHATIYNSTLSHYFKNEAKNKELISTIMYEMIEKGNHITKEQYIKALADQEDLISTMDVFMKDFDIGLCLSTVGEAPLREEIEKDDQCLMWTLCHLPVINLPVFTSPSGLPFGAQVFARKYNDLLLLRFVQYLKTMSCIK
jgi:Asp-tRNA(Asn)/Glu-tRNA(Gln) amidotransferase A subunit family amidase